MRVTINSRRGREEEPVSEVVVIPVEVVPSAHDGSPDALFSDGSPSVSEPQNSSSMKATPGSSSFVTSPSESTMSSGMGTSSGPRPSSKTWCSPVGGGTKTSSSRRVAPSRDDPASPCTVPSTCDPASSSRSSSPAWSSPTGSSPTGSSSAPRPSSSSLVPSSSSTG